MTWQGKRRKQLPAGNPLKRFVLRRLDAMAVPEATATALDGYEKAFRRGAQFGWLLGEHGQTVEQRDAQIDDTLNFILGPRMPKRKVVNGPSQQGDPHA